MSGKPAARQGDYHVCPKYEPPAHVGGPILPPCCPTVLIGNKPAARIDDKAQCNGSPDTISTGSATVLIGGKKAARKGDRTQHGGIIIEGEPTVLIGDTSNQAECLLKAAQQGKACCEQYPTSSSSSNASSSSSNSSSSSGSSGSSGGSESGGFKPIVPFIPVDPGSGEKTSSEDKMASSDTQCCHENLELEAQAGKRGEERTLTLPGELDTMQIVSAIDERTIIARTKLTAGPCSNHRGKVLTLKGGTEKSRSDEKLVFKAGCHERYALSPSLLANLRNIWPSPAEIKELEVSNSTCNATGYTARLHVYPDVQWAADIGFNFGEQENSGKLSARTVYQEAKTSKGWHGGLSVTSGGTTHEFTAEALKKTESMTRTVYRTFDMAKEMAGLLKRVTGSEISLQFPNFALKGDWGYEQHPERLGVLMAYSLTLAMDPLIGMGFRIDILDQLIKLLPAGAGVVLSRVKKALEKKEIAKARCDLFAEGKISGELKVQRQGKAKAEASGFVQGEIGVGIEACLEGSFNAWFIETSAGMKGSAESGVSGKITAAGDDRGPYWQGSITWDGVVFKGTVYISADVKIKSSDNKKKHAPVQKDGSSKQYRHTKEDDTLDASREAKYSGEYTLIDSKTWNFSKNYFLPHEQ